MKNNGIENKERSKESVINAKYTILSKIKKQIES